MASAALRQWELENATKIVDPHRDALYAYDAQAQRTQNEAKPWRSDENFFKAIRISAVAMLKMVMHARSGGAIEVMGLMQGHISGNEFIVTDAFRLPVEGTETRVNAQDSANEYMVEFLGHAREAGQVENAVGWYHSHPGYGCWLSGIDVSTQLTQQMFQDPFVAVVIDPDRTISAGKVEVGAFRTYSENYTKDKSASTDVEGFETIPLAKAEDFGAYADRYYSLEVSHFKSTLDADLLESLWNKYWVGTLTASPLFTNRDYGTKQIADLAEKLRRAEQSKRAHGRNQMARSFAMGAKKQNNQDEQMEAIVKAGNKITAEEEAGLLASDIKDRLFSGVRASS